jgi:hypothetical protein
MSDRKKLKYTITKAVMDQLPYNNTPIESHISDWWFTKSGDSLRLTPRGDFNFREANIEFFDLPVKVKKTNWYKFLSECNKKIKCPYYFSVNKDVESKEPFIRLYDSKIAMMLALYGDIESYLESVRTRQ